MNAQSAHNLAQINHKSNQQAKDNQEQLKCHSTIKFRASLGYFSAPCKLDEFNIAYFQSLGYQVDDIDPMNSTTFNAHLKW